jgi:hypothetical protein
MSLSLTGSLSPISVELRRRTSHVLWENYSLAIDHRPPVENVASLVNGFLIHVVVSHRHLHVTVA